MAYVPPVWSDTDFDFSVAFVVPRWGDVRFDLGAQNDLDQWIGPRGHDSLQGSFVHTVSLNRYVSPSGVSGGGFGNATINKGYFRSFDFCLAYSPPSWNAVSFSFADNVKAVGIGDGAFGAPSLFRLDVVRPDGIGDGAFGAPALFRVDVILPTGIDGGAFGDHSLTSESARKTFGGVYRRRLWPESVVVKDVIYDDEEEEVAGLIVSLAASGAFDFTEHRI